MWYVGERLVVPKTSTENEPGLHEILFRMVHDNLGHFGFYKCYENLRASYFWPNMRKDLEESYIPGCVECQRNKSPARKTTGPLHPNPVPDGRGKSVACDFIGPLPEDEGFNCILTMSDRLGCDYQFIPTRTDISAEQFALLFVDNWVFENGVPDDFVCDRDKLFVSKFWKAVSKLLGIKIKMSSTAHPQTDGLSERTNKTVNQALRFHVERNQSGWKRALRRIRFNFMNTVNKSTGYSPFQLKYGRSPRMMPVLVATETEEESDDVAEFLRRIAADVEDAKDNLMLAKISQAYQVNSTHSSDHTFKVGDQVMLSTANRRQEYKNQGENRVAKFMPRFDGPYEVIKAHPETSNYTLKFPRATNIFPTFHISQLKPFIPNNDSKYPSRTFKIPEPVWVEGYEEHFVDKIVDERVFRKKKEYLVRWQGFHQEHDQWMKESEIEDNKALDVWLKERDGISLSNSATCTLFPLGF